MTRRVTSSIVVTRCAFFRPARFFHAESGRIPHRWPRDSDAVSLRGSLGTPIGKAVRPRAASPPTAFFALQVLPSYTARQSAAGTHCERARPRKRSWLLSASGKELLHRQKLC